MVWIVCPSIGCGGVFRSCAMVASVHCVVCGWFQWGVSVGRGGNSEWACCNASFMILGACLYVVRNYSGVNMAIVSLFWICGSIVIPYAYSLSSYCWNFVFALFVKLAYVELDLHACSSGVFLMGNARFVVVVCILYTLSSRKSLMAMGDLVQACC
jgi:hypothetical protein